ncbi:DUF2220 domain-containing protein [Halosquirtibacter xylanolyticus]|uniref:Wadjet anti-phage system protein JetD domain-containing protein n=1 Tax=Halosquirtibacter xylanolyticus TaxID=3374599 RepID=UPI003749F602|nr:DUF2220 domain-containing protein [Prolixibacteraceae bacterium]
MKITLKIAKNLSLLQQGESLPYGGAKSTVLDRMIEEGVVSVQLIGRTRKVVSAPNIIHLNNYLQNQYGIGDLMAYIETLETPSLRAESVRTSSDSKVTKVRTFKGFMVNTLEPIEAHLGDKPILIAPPEGTFTYIYDYEALRLPPEVIVVGVENAENFRYLNEQLEIFPSEPKLFVSRYPQSKDLLSWLLTIENNYLHFGDFDFEGLRIFEHSYRKHLGERASLLVPRDLEAMLSKYGNRSLYDKQYRSQGDTNLDLPYYHKIISLFHRYKRCLEQEVYIASPEV